jgi:hypothetical protein
LDAEKVHCKDSEPLVAKIFGPIALSPARSTMSRAPCECLGMMRVAERPTASLRKFCWLPRLLFCCPNYAVAHSGQWRRELDCGTKFRYFSRVKQGRRIDSGERALMRRYYLSISGFDGQPDLENRYRSELARRGWTWYRRTHREPRRWRSDCPRHAQRWLDAHGHLAGFSRHQIIEMVRADQDLSKRRFRIFVEDSQLVGSDEPSEIEYRYLKACAVVPRIPEAVRLESDDPEAVAAGDWIRESRWASGRERCLLRARQTSWEPRCQAAGVSWLGPTPAQVKAILRYIGGAEADIAANLGVDARSLRHWKEGARAVSPQNWQLLLILAGFRPAWLDVSLLRDLLSAPTPDA